MDSVVQPHQYVAVRMSSGMYKLVKAAPNTTILLGKYGSFYTNHIIGRPFHQTYELLPTPEEDGYSLRVVPAAELHAEALISEGSAEVDGLIEEPPESGSAGQQPIRSNRDINDDGSAQTLTWEEIEDLKRNTTGAGKEIIDKLLESHSTIDKKTAFSLAKYKLRKEKKYLKRFTIVPLDVNILTEYMLEQKEAHRIMELRHELIGLLGCWGNVHHSGNLENVEPNGRYLVIDDTGGLVVAAMAERMGILHPPGEDEEDEEVDDGLVLKEEETSEVPTQSDPANEHRHTGEQKARPQTRPHAKRQPMTAKQNSITVIHPHSQPNLSLLKYFGYDTEEPNVSHPLFEHLKLATWLQVLDPEADNIYSEKPEEVDEATLKTYKPRQRGTYHRKHARWARVRRVVDEIRAGGYDGLVVASVMDPDSILRHLVPLLSGGASIAVYSPSVEPLTLLMDLYSTARRSAYISKKADLEKERRSIDLDNMDVDLPSVESQLASEFSLDPTLVLAPMLQTSRVREWQVLPGRTHPLMSGRGGAEGYIFHGIRAIPQSQHVQARGVNSRKKRKLDVGDNGTPDDGSTPVAA
ncbi:eukaryotic translation initiation factor 3, gamma subunit, putative [Talaromyces stipitatus ATCC 10500]|uniref:tRNA (adenine(58)-N(1))-methyltransferase non-catalytic subunit TRM6 n=1 Tax=Talaromyces stipitatus (strain ATCC 10500 / CBS 375.48 / QM 6759 / NRRL 1006) TaxID=441959 RepID=B8LWT4_TALSN|nr:eukaryotic translation initiation factor 3, gamma subunit, putative [Talaromyces stipitatus ATCC 10500]EED24567.1 eukaryotic translation initiation factor 3, gamma subunit, putative [Talaromyces stipitatus ATCC 10500]